MTKLWIKHWVEPHLNGPDRIDMTPAQRSVWMDLKTLAANAPVEGIISDKDGGPPSLRKLSRELGISWGLLVRTIDICFQTGRLRSDEHGIHLITWDQEQAVGPSPTRRGNGSLPSEDPNKFVKGKLGHMVNTTAEDVAALQEERQRRLGENARR